MDDEKRWFVYFPDKLIPEDVGAEGMDIIGGDLIFYNEERRITFAYARGTWRFVEFQGE